MRILLWLALAAAPQPDDSAVDALIAQLDGLPEDADADAFLRRPALMELVAQADTAAPALGRAAAGSPRWSVRASAAYALAANGYHGRLHDLVPGGFARLLDDPHPVVRAVAAQGWGSDRAKEMLTAGPVAEVARRLRLPGPFDAQDWLPEEYYRRRLDRFTELALAAPPLTETPEWGEVHQPALTPDASIVAGNLGKEVQHSRRGHMASVRVVDLLSRARPDLPSQRAYLLDLALYIVSHEGEGHERHACPDATAFYDRIAHFAQQGLWESQDPYFLTSAVRAFSELALQHHAPSLEILKRLARDHPVAEAREWAQSLLQTYLQLKAEYDARHARGGRPPGPQSEAPRPVDTPPTSSPGASFPQDDPADGPPPPGWGLWSILAAGVLLLGLLAAILRRR